MSTGNEQCAEMVWKAEGHWGQRYRCQRKAGFGPQSQYCSQHAEKYTEGEPVQWYRASCYTDYSCEVVPVEVLKETAETLLIKGTNGAKREKKRSEWYAYFPTHESAIDFYRGRVQALRSRVDRLENAMNDLAGQEETK